MTRVKNVSLLWLSCFMLFLILSCGKDDVTKPVITKDVVQGTWSTHGGVPSPTGNGSFLAVMSFVDTNFKIVILFQHKADTSIKDSVHIEKGTWTFGTDSIRMVRQECRQLDTNDQKIYVIPCGATNASLPTPTDPTRWDIPLPAISVYLEAFVQGIPLNPDIFITLRKN
jgi:hypothetical protein